MAKRKALGLIDEAVEGVKDLLFMHNTNAKKLARQDAIGGLPNPSIAVTQKDIPFEGFGDITLVGKPDRFDPAMRGNPMYSADAYTVRSPAPVRLAKSSATNDFDNDFRAYREFGNVDNPSYNLSQLKYKSNADPYDFGQVDHFLEYDTAASVKFFNDIGVDVPRKQNGDIDRYALSELKMQYADKFDEWKDGLMNKYFEPDEYFVTNPDYDRYSGRPNLKPYTAENLSKWMNKNAGAGKESTVTFGAGNLRASTTEQIKSLQEAKQRKGILKSGEEVSVAKSTANEVLSDLQDALRDYYKYDTGSFYYYDEVGRMIADSEKIGLERALKKYDFENVPKELIQEIEDYKGYLRSAPTEYFESKPERAVQMSDFAGAIVPENTPKGLIDRLTDAGLRVEKYGDEAERVAARNKFKDYMFVRPEAAITAGLLTAGALTSKDVEAGVFGAPTREIAKRFLNKDSLLFHSGTADQAESIAKYGIEPQYGDWVKSVYSGAVDDVDEYLSSLPQASWYSEAPNWIKGKVAQKLGKPVSEVTEKDILEHGALSVVDPSETFDGGSEFFKIPAEGVSEGERTAVQNLLGDEFKLYETPLYEYNDMLGTGNYVAGLEPKDIVTTESIDPIATYTGKDLLEFLSLINQSGNANPMLLAGLAGGSLLGAAVMPKDAEASLLGVGSTIGKKAEDMLGMAMTMRDRGVDSAEIWKKTGWEFNEADGRWRTEHSNYDNTKITMPEEAGTYKFWDLVDDPVLRGAYDSDSSGRVIDMYGLRSAGGTPFESLQVEITPYLPPNDAEIRGPFIRVGEGTSPDEFRKTILHELQHVIQQRENFATGGNTDMFRDRRDMFDTGEFETRMNALTERVRLANDFVNNPPESATFDQMRQAYQILETDGPRIEAMRAYERDSLQGQRSPFQMYEAMTGEVEARNIEERDQPRGLMREFSPEATEDARFPRGQQIALDESRSPYYDEDYNKVNFRTSALDINYPRQVTVGEAKTPEANYNLLDAVVPAVAAAYDYGDGANFPVRPAQGLLAPEPKAQKSDITPTPSVVPMGVPINPYTFLMSTGADQGEASRYVTDAYTNIARGAGNAMAGFGGEMETLGKGLMYALTGQGLGGSPFSRFMQVLNKYDPQLPNTQDVGRLPALLPNVSPMTEEERRMYQLAGEFLSPL